MKEFLIFIFGLMIGGSVGAFLMGLIIGGKRND